MSKIIVIYTNYKLKYDCITFTSSFFSLIYQTKFLLMTQRSWYETKTPNQWKDICRLQLSRDERNLFNGYVRMVTYRQKSIQFPIKKKIPFHVEEYLVSNVFHYRILLKIKNNIEMIKLINRQTIDNIMTQFEYLTQLLNPVAIWDKQIMHCVGLLYIYINHDNHKRKD